MVTYAGAKFGLGSIEFNMTRYYITGEGPNPALKSLKYSHALIESCYEFFRDYQDDFEKMCPQWAPTNVTVDLLIAWGGSEQCDRLLGPANIYPYYHSAVHEIICGSAVSNLGWLIFFQVLVGMLCLPVVTCMASWFLVGVTAERENFRGFSLVSQEELDDVY